MNLAELFGRPEWLLPAFAIPVFVWLSTALADLRAARALAAACGPRAAELNRETTPGRRLLRRSSFAVGLLFALLAAAEPAWGLRERTVEQRGVDLVVCLDVSRSMLARDVRPDRLRRAQAELRALAERTRGDRLALVVFAGEARRRIPLTRDVATFAEICAAQDPASVGRGGTDLGAALDTALEAFDATSGAHRTIVLITDGEDRNDAGLRAAAAARDRGVVVHCVGMGTALGSKIVVRDADGRETFLRDRDGNEVVSALDSTSLRRIARATGGAFVDGTQGGAALVRLFEQRILPLAQRPRSLAEGAERAPRFQWLLGLALLAWCCEIWLGARRTT